MSTVNRNKIIKSGNKILENTKNPIVPKNTQKNIVTKINKNTQLPVIETPKYNDIIHLPKIINTKNRQINKFNGIDAIFWINLDRSVDRKKLFEKQIKIYNTTKIPVTRITAYDGSVVNVNDIITNLNVLDIRNMKTNEICCLLSHLYAILTASTYKGEYFLILEDDVIMNNLKYINSLKSIITKCPQFDILMLSKLVINDNSLTNEQYTLRVDSNISGTQSYIISRNGIEKIKSLFSYTDGKFNFNTNYLSFADFYIYENCITYFYKYNLFFEKADNTLLDHNLEFARNSNKINDLIILKNLNKCGLLQ